MKYRALLFKTVSDIRASYWFIPACLASLALVSARLLVWFEYENYWVSGLIPSSLTDTKIEDARLILSVIAQSVIGVAGVMFSVTMVAVSFASGNFGPRLIENFMRDRGNQWSLGILIATFVFTLMVMRSIQGDVTDGVDLFVPQMPIVVAMCLALLSVGVVIYFVHHVPETINVSNIAASLGRRFCAQMADTAQEVPPDHDTRGVKPTEEAGLNTHGYVQRIDMAKLSDLAETFDITIWIDRIPGHFVHPGQTVFRCSKALEDDQLSQLRACFALGAIKTEDQNLLFLAEQQVEMIARALSPGVNDPFTAINCLNWLTAGLAAGMQKGTVFGIHGSDKVIVPETGIADVLDATFGASLDYIKGDKIVKQTWKTLLRDLAASLDGDTAKEVDAWAKKHDTPV
ncbi:MAG: DUF2254 domain-containing protein [Pseudomonadota bacterium]